MIEMSSFRKFSKGFVRQQILYEEDTFSKEKKHLK